MRGLVFAGAVGLGLVVAAGCAVGVVDDTVEDDASVPSGDASASATTTRPDGSTAPTTDGSTSPRDAEPADVVVPGPDTGTDAGGCTGGLVINEVQTEGTGGADHEFVEVYNPNTCDVSLEGWTLKYSSSGGSTPSTFFTGGSTHKVLAKGYFVIACTPFTGAKNATYSGGKLAADSGQVGLFDKLGARVDAIGYGTIATADRVLTEGSPSPSPGGPPRSVQRTPNGADSNNNQTDFRAATATPGGPSL